MKKKIAEMFILTTTNEIFKKMVVLYPTKHLFKNYYLMRNNAYGVMGPSLWGIVKVKKDIPNTTETYVGF